MRPWRGHNALLLLTLDMADSPFTGKSVSSPAKSLIRAGNRRVNWQRGAGGFGRSAGSEGKTTMTIANIRAMLRPIVSAIGGIALLIAAASAFGNAALAQGAVRSVHGDWQIRCDTPPGAHSEQCALMQSVTAEDRPNVGLTVIVLKTADQKSRLMRVVAPLGVLLPSGLGLKIDNNDVGRAGFVRCLPNGCIAEVVMDDQLIDRLRNGKTSTFIIFQTPEEGIGFPMSLKGFGEGYDKLP
jgi:invasion protein IalB